MLNDNENAKIRSILQTSINEVDKDEDHHYALFPGFQQRDRQPLPAILPPQDDVYQDADESQPLTSESQQDTPQHMANQMMVTPAVSKLILSFLCLKLTRKPLLYVSSHFHP